MCGHVSLVARLLTSSSQSSYQINANSLQFSSKSYSITGLASWSLVKSLTNLGSCGYCGFVGEICGACVGHMWYMCGRSMVDVWYVCGRYLVRLLCGICVGDMWYAYMCSV